MTPLGRRRSAAPRAVLDSNVVLSALIFRGGAAARLRDAWTAGECVPIISSATTQELMRVLGYPKFRLFAAEQEELLADYLPFCQAVRVPSPAPAVPACRDPFDLPFLQLAVAGTCARHRRSGSAGAGNNSGLVFDPDAAGVSRRFAEPLRSRSCACIANEISTDRSRRGRPTSRKGSSMKKVAAEPYRDIDFSNAKRGPVIPSEPGKTKISIRMDNTVIEYFRAQVERAGAGIYQTLMNDALLAFIQQRSVIDAVRQVVREELSSPKAKPRQLRSRPVSA
jgi:uncharacterized protein